MFKGTPIDGKKLARMRDGLYTQEELARELGVSKGAISRIEGLENTGMRPKTFRKLSDLFRRPLEDLKAALAPTNGHADSPQKRRVDEFGLSSGIRAVAEERAQEMGISLGEFVSAAVDAVLKIEGWRPGMPLLTPREPTIKMPSGESVTPKREAAKKKG